MPHVVSPEQPSLHQPVPMVRRCCLAAFSLLLALAPPIWGADVAPAVTSEATAAIETTPPPEENPLPPPSMASNVQGATTNALIDLSNSIDTFFADPSSEETFNKTRLRLRGGVEFVQGGDLNLLQNVRLNFDLPQTRRHLNLFFSRDKDDVDEEQSRGPAPAPSTGEEKDFHFNMRSGLRYAISSGHSHLVQFTVGSELFPDVNAFTELRGNMVIPLGNWIFQPSQSLFWREQEKFGETSRFDFDFPFVNSNSRVRWRFEGTYSQSSPGYAYMVQTSYSRQFKMERGFVLALQSNGETNPDADITIYQATANWRQLIYKDWLFFEVGTRLNFPENDGFQPEPAVSILLETNFGNFTRAANQ